MTGRETIQKKLKGWAEEYNKKVDEFKAELDRITPEWAKSVIVATLERDNCDSQTDYCATSDERRVILGFSKTNRNNFNEMRKLAENMKETLHLCQMGKEVEHRENYSMGKGLYLKDGTAYDSGWMISKERIEWGINVAETHLVG